MESMTSTYVIASRKAIQFTKNTSKLRNKNEKRKAQARDNGMQWKY